MEATQAIAIARQHLLAEPPGTTDGTLLEASATDHGWCWVISWTSRKSLESNDPGDVPPPGIGPIAVDKADGEAFYLSSAPLPVALEMAKHARGR